MHLQIAVLDWFTVIHKKIVGDRFCHCSWLHDWKRIYFYLKLFELFLLNCAWRNLRSFWSTHLACSLSRNFLNQSQENTTAWNARGNGEWAMSDRIHYLFMHLCIQAFSSSSKWPQNGTCWIVNVLTIILSDWQIETPSQIWRITENYHVRCNGIDIYHRDPHGSFLSSHAVRTIRLNFEWIFHYIVIVRRWRYAKASSSWKLHFAQTEIICTRVLTKCPKMPEEFLQQKENENWTWLLLLK